MKTSLMEFFDTVENILTEGEKKYKDFYLEEDSQIPYIKEKCQRISSKVNPKEKNLEDLAKIAAYAFLEWKKEGGV